MECCITKGIFPAPNLKKYSYDQVAMIVVNFKDQLRPNTFEFTLHYLIEDYNNLSVSHEEGLVIRPYI
ncbi:hypothetical protein R50072_34460 [Simiduia litorea]